MVVSLPASLGLGDRISEELNVKHEMVEYKVFPDGESYMRMNFDPKGEDVIVVQTTYPDQNRRLLELFMAIRTLMKRGAHTVSAVIPYLAYARQDREFLKGEVVSAEEVLELLSLAGLSQLYVVDVHKPETLSRFKGVSVNILPSRIFAREARKIGLTKPIVIAPDAGAEHRAKMLAELLGTTYLVFRKFRDRHTGAIRHELPATFRLEGEDAIVVDDIISTGGTVSEIAQYLKARGASKVYVMASHGIFVGDAVRRISQAGADAIYVLKTVEKRVEGVTYLDITDEVVEALRNPMSIGRG
jgi:ribose-phosphate pyrophosphokinase